jgi:hypothetical protein
MEQVIKFLNVWLGFLFEGLRSVIGTVVSFFDWPAALIGVPPELFAAGLLCALLLLAWRALGPLIT